jgi:hypothetical protein
MVQRAYPDAPDVTIVVKRDERAWGHTTVAKTWAPSHAEDDPRSYELMISGENLRRGAEAVVGTLLHEAAHARNLANGVLDCDVNGRHNVRFKTTAEAHGLSVEQAGWHGWTKTELTDEGRTRWARMIKTVDAGLRKSAVAMPHRGRSGAAVPPTSGGAATPRKRGNRNLLKATCECGHSIRVSQGVLDAAEPTCSACGEPFTVAQ